MRVVIQHPIHNSIGILRRMFNMTNNDAIREVVKKTFCEGFLDDHFSGDDKFVPKAVCLFIRGVGCEAGVCPAWENTVFSLNPLVEIDGEIHLSTASCGGTIDCRGGRSLEKACEQYNREHAFSEYPRALFSQVIVVRRDDYLKRFGE